MFDKIFTILFNLLFFTTPLLMAPFTSELFEFNKLVFIYLISLGAAFFWVLKMILTRKIIIKKTPFDIPIFLFFASQVLATIFSLDQHTSFYGYYGRFNGGLLSLISYLVLYYSFVSNLSITGYLQNLIFLLKTSLITSVIVIIWGLSGKVGIDFSCLLFVGQIGNNCWTDQFRPSERMFSTLGQPNWLGAYLAINFFIGVFFLLKNILSHKKINSNYFVWLFYLFLNFSSILFTRSRSALFAVCSGIAMLTIYLFIRFRGASIGLVRNLLLASLLSLLISVLLFKTGVDKIDKFISLSTYYQSLDLNSERERGSNQKSKGGQTAQNSPDSGVTASSDIRKIVWRGAIELGLKYPVLGTGVETFAYSYYFTRPVEHNLTSEWDFLYNKAHNEYLNYFATTGFAGVLSYLVLIFTVVIYSWQKLNTLNTGSKITSQKAKQEKFDTQLLGQYNNSLLIICLLISYLTILITNFFGFSTTTVNLFFYLLPAFLILLSTKTTEQISLPALNFKDKKQLILLLPLMFVSVTTLFNLGRYYFADIKYTQGDNYNRLGDYQNAAQLITEANNLKYEHVYLDKLSNILANIAFTASYQKENEVAKKLISASNDLNQKTLTASPQNVLYWKTRAKNYYLYYQVSLNENDLNEAINALQKARKLSLTDPKIPYSLAIFYSLLEDATKDQKQKSEYGQLALSEIDLSIKLKPDYRDGYFLKSQLLRKSGNPEEAKEILNYILKNLNPNDTEVRKELETL